MKLYVWKDVLCDYTCGMVCVLANDLEEALKLYDALNMGEKLGSPTLIVTEPAAFAVWGGG